MNPECTLVFRWPSRYDECDQPHTKPEGGYEPRFYEYIPTPAGLEARLRAGATAETVDMSTVSQSHTF